LNGDHKTTIFSRVAKSSGGTGPGILSEENGAAGGYFGGVLSSLLPQGSGAEPAADDEGWSTDGPAWINRLPNDHKRFLMRQVSARTESQGPEGGKAAKLRLVRALRNRFGVTEARAVEAIAWVQGS
jgi:hypothetical protein